MKLIVLGNYGTFPGKNGACSGYLLQDKGVNILIDCGNGVMSRLQNYCSINDLDAIVLTHLHRDHTSDMHILKYAIETMMEFKTMNKAIKVYLPLTPFDEYKSFIYKDVYKLFSIQDRNTIDIKGIKVSFFEMSHSVESYGIRVENNGKVFSYSGDTVFNDNIKSLAQNSDFFMCEATATERMKSMAPNIPHLTPREAALIASEAKVKLLGLTHFWFEEERETYFKEAYQFFENVILSEENKEYLF
ncbi:MBL fold metallo-hydrolase [Clostridium swellfunianum]|uniref:MBL fold metallo-hydrolase n=1 Tax=Clostridium swellfunianum TaxID=1367462 RepID=UPI00202DDA81|nr:MBL fold metallo-hydrolase [Clostridium swellfunianum]MCM0646918.1 MBL fold metallo-hydrolase [Clostridium swellfunianum]